MADPAHRPATFDDLLALDPERGWEILAGDLVQKAAPTGEHADAQAGLAGALRGPFHRPGGGDPPGGWWILTEATVELESHELIQPDVAGWRRDRAPARPAGWPVRVRPDWVCEVLSPSTALRDLGPKMRLLHRHGVEHYWTVDPAARFLAVYRRTDEGYLLVLTAGPGERCRAEPFDAIELDVGTLFGEDPLP
jgi:Uma2 family endonuclease